MRLCGPPEKSLARVEKFWLSDPQSAASSESASQESRVSESRSSEDRRLRRRSSMPVRLRRCACDDDEGFTRWKRQGNRKRHSHRLVRRAPSQHPRRRPLDERRAPRLLRHRHRGARARAHVLGLRDPGRPQCRRRPDPARSRARQAGAAAGAEAAAFQASPRPQRDAFRRAPTDGPSASRFCRSRPSSRSNSPRRPGSRCWRFRFSTRR